jgi:hypothetical protein
MTAALAGASRRLAVHAHKLRRSAPAAPRADLIQAPRAAPRRQRNLDIDFSDLSAERAAWARAKARTSEDKAQAPLLVSLLDRDPHGRFLLKRPHADG